LLYPAIGLDKTVNIRREHFSFLSLAVVPTQQQSQQSWLSGLQQRRRCQFPWRLTASQHQTSQSQEGWGLRHCERPEHPACFVTTLPGGRVLFVDCPVSKAKQSRVSGCCSLRLRWVYLSAC